MTSPRTTLALILLSLAASCAGATAGVQRRPPAASVELWVLATETCVTEGSTLYCVGASSGLGSPYPTQHSGIAALAEAAMSQLDTSIAHEPAGRVLTAEQMHWWRASAGISAQRTLAGEPQRLLRGECDCVRDWCPCRALSTSVRLDDRALVERMVVISTDTPAVCALFRDGVVRRCRLQCGAECLLVECQAEPERAVALSNSARQWCALGEDGRVRCADRVEPAHSAATAVVAGLERARAIAGSEDMQCALSGASHVECWTEHERRTIALPDSLNVQQLRAGAARVCVLGTRATRKEVWCWGDGSFGAAGSLRSTHVARPTRAPLAGPVDRVYVGAFHSCARLQQSGDLYCWGANFAGQIAAIPARMPSRRRTEQLRSVDAPTRVATGVSEPVRLDPARTCWTEGGAERCLGEASAPSTRSRSCASWATMLPDAGVSEDGIACSWHHACFVDRERAVFCWGDDQFFQSAPFAESRRFTANLTLSILR